MIGYGPLQILASALPGFRDLRAPIIAGYMWLVFAWLIVQPDPNHRPDGGVGAAVYDLGHDVGRVWVFIAVGGYRLFNRRYFPAGFDGCARHMAGVF